MNESGRSTQKNGKNKPEAGFDPVREMWILRTDNNNLEALGGYFSNGQPGLNVGAS